MSTSRFARSAVHKTRNGAVIALELIGDWADLVGYYAGTDGHAWRYSVADWRFTNCGELSAFRATFTQRYCGRLFPE